MKSFFSIQSVLGMLCLCIGIAAFLGCDAEAKGDTYLVNIDKSGVILDGYDPVAFFKEQKPVEGNATITYAWHDATYRFSSEENKTAFVANPEAYAPQYGGYCGYAVSLGHLAPIDVNFFSIIDGRLILQHNQKALDGWNSNANSLTLADKYWPTLLQRKGKPVIPEEEKKYLVNVNDDGFIAEGYDVVAYSTQHMPVKGDPTIVKLYRGAFYAFASEENKQAFGMDPEKYVPQYGGYCAYAVSRDKLRPINPKYFQFVDGRLMLQHSQNALDLFSEDIPGNTQKADMNWPRIVAERSGKQMAGLYDEAVQ